MKIITFRGYRKRVVAYNGLKESILSNYPTTDLTSTCPLNWIG